MKLLLLSLFLSVGCVSQNEDPVEVGLMKTQLRLPTEKEKAKALEEQMRYEDMTPMERRRIQS